MSIDMLQWIIWIFGCLACYNAGRFFNLKEFFSALVNALISVVCLIISLSVFKHLLKDIICFIQ